MISVEILNQGEFSKYFRFNNENYSRYDMIDTRQIYIWHDEGRPTDDPIVIILDTRHGTMTCMYHDGYVGHYSIGGWGTRL